MRTARAAAGGAGAEPGRPRLLCRPLPGPQLWLQKQPCPSVPTGSARAYGSSRPHRTAGPLGECLRSRPLRPPAPQRWAAGRRPHPAHHVPTGSGRRAGAPGPAGPFRAERRRRPKGVPRAPWTRGAAGNWGVWTAGSTSAVPRPALPSSPLPGTPPLPSVFVRMGKPRLGCRASRAPHTSEWLHPPTIPGAPALTLTRDVYFRGHSRHMESAGKL